MPISFKPAGKPPTLTRIWIPALLVSIFFMFIAYLAGNTLIITCICEAIFLPFYLAFRRNIEITISTDEKTLYYYYMNCWGRKKAIEIDIPTLKGSYKFEHISSARWGWVLDILNDKHHKLTVTQGIYNKIQLDQIVRIINRNKQNNLIEL